MNMKQCKLVQSLFLGRWRYCHQRVLQALLCGSVNDGIISDIWSRISAHHRGMKLWLFGFVWYITAVLSFKSGPMVSHAIWPTCLHKFGRHVQAWSWMANRLCCLWSKFNTRCIYKDDLYTVRSVSKLAVQYQVPVVELSYILPVPCTVLV